MTPEEFRDRLAAIEADVNRLFVEALNEQAKRNPPWNRGGRYWALGAESLDAMVLRPQFEAMLKERVEDLEREFYAPFSEKDTNICQP